MENNNNKILALKYRPKNFEELIGQEMMVQTIINSIKTNKIPNAYLLTGIRGVGKTTTARIIAKSLNCNKHFDHGDQNEVKEFCNCDAISNSKHLDILEMDAASKTGIDDIRELIESSKYNPTSAKYKIIILDEVHMLSKQAFNGLLKTLEEPPLHLKFIFATTEVKKIPVTIISRCQRFDLHRVPIKTLMSYLKKILKIENGKISESALKLIAQASEGSVRDSLSLLDRTLVSQDISQEEINEEFVRKMLGIADRSKIIELLNFIFKGEQKKSIENLRLMIDEGLEPKNFLNDILEIIYFILQHKNLGSLDSNLSISESQLKMIDSISKDISQTTLIVFWQFIFKGLEELSIVNNQTLALEMLVIRLIHLKDIPPYEDILNLINKSDLNVKSEDTEIETFKKINLDKEKQIKKISKDQIKNTTQMKPKLVSLDPENIKKNLDFETILSFKNLIKLSSEKREVELKYDLERNVNLIKFSEGKIDISFNENLKKSFVRDLSEKLLKWTGKRWLITLTKELGQKTFSASELEKKTETLEKEKKSEVYKNFKNIFSDGELIEVLKKD